VTCFTSPLASAAPAARFVRFLSRSFWSAWIFLTIGFAGNGSDGLPELGGDGLHREILRDETVLRLKELGKVRPPIDS
jgi:hypothetical protein